MLWLLSLPLLQLLIYRVPFRGDGVSGKNPKGGVQECTPFFYATGANRKEAKHCFALVSGLAPWGDCPGPSCIAAGSRRKIPLAEWTRRAVRGAETGQPSAFEKHFLATFLCMKKEK